MAGDAIGYDPADPLHELSDPASYWTTANIGEAVPGVLTPLGWTLFGPVIELGIRRGLAAIGLFADDEARWPDNDQDRLVRVFHARGALSVDGYAALGDRMPGTTGPESLESVFGESPPALDYQPTRRRYPAIAVKLPRQFLGVAKRLEKTEAETGAWWRRKIPQLATADLDHALAVFDEASQRFQYNVTLQATAAYSAVMPMYEALGELTERTGVGDVPTLTGGYGGQRETGVVDDLWRASRGELELEQVVARHGFHGPDEGEISGRVWREDAAPLQRMVDEYAKLDSSERPGLREQKRREERLEAERRLVAALPAAARRPVRGMLRLAERKIPLRGVAKMAFLQSLDVARAAARRAGVQLASEGRLEDPEDVFMLTVDELRGPLPADAKELVEFRRGRRAKHAEIVLPSHWVGQPKRITVADDAAQDGDQPGLVLEGAGVSTGVVEGVARVVTDPAFAEVEPGEILVSPTTDPSWSSIMFISSALVVDIGGALSHAAIVARELGIPCVVNTLEGSRRLRNGDRLRVDGGAGTVEVLERPVGAAT